MKKTSEHKGHDETITEYEYKTLELEIVKDHEAKTFVFTVYSGFDRGDGLTHYSLSTAKSAAKDFIDALKFTTHERSK